MSQPPLPPPERFDRKDVTGYLTDRISIGRKDGSVALVLSGPDDINLVFQTSPAGARQVAASLLNQADELEDPSPGGRRP
jgi:hypothetical protein